MSNETKPEPKAKKELSEYVILKASSPTGPDFAKVGQTKAVNGDKALENVVGKSIADGGTGGYFVAVSSKSFKIKPVGAEQPPPRIKVG